LAQNQRLALNLAQPAASHDTLSWQERAEVDHIFPRSYYSNVYPLLVNDIGNLSYLGKLRNIRKSDQQPWEYFADLSDDELRDTYLIERSLLAEERFPEFVERRRTLILEKVKSALGR
jgi:hypothetical protein